MVTCDEAQVRISRKNINLYFEFINTFEALLIIITLSVADSKNQ